MNILPQKNVRLVLAPMAGITDWPFRLQCQMHGADETVSEMISAMGLLQAPKGNAATKFLLAHHGQEKNLTAQLFGREPDLMGRAAEILSSLPYYKGIDLNFGCPAPKVTSSGSGSALMKDLALSGSILRAVRRATRLPLSVKMRIGWDRNSINAEEFAKLCEDAGVDSLCVHGRTREQQYSGKADWSTIALVKQKVRIPVIANGDVFTPQDAAGLMESDLTVSYEKLVIDNEILGMCQRVLRGIEVDDETLAAGLMIEKGPGEDYMMEAHTLEHMRGEFFVPRLANRDKREMMQPDEDALARARRLVQQVRAEPPARRLDAEVRQQILKAFPEIKTPQA